VTHVAADPIAVITMNVLCSMISEYECNKAITSNAKKITFRTARPGQKTLGSRGAGTRTPAASNRASMSVAHITRVVSNTVSGIKVDARASRFKYFVRTRIHWYTDWFPTSVNAQKAEYMACFSVCMLSHLCHTECCGIIPLKSAMCFPPICSDQKHLKKNRLAAQNYLFKIKNPLDVHHFFDQSTLELVTFMFLSVERTTEFANYPKTTTYFLAVKEK
jgi:hypothetical protein